MFEATTNFATGTQLEITLDSNHGNFNNLDAIIQVARTELNKDSNLFAIGAKIIRLL